MATLLQTNEPENGLLDGVTNSQKAVILKECGLLVSKSLRNFLSFLFRKNDTSELLVYNMVLRNIPALA